MTTSERDRIAVVYPCPAGVGGWGQCVAATIRDLAPHYHVSAIGPGFVESWALSRQEAEAVDWIDVPAGSNASPLSAFRRRFLPGREIYLGHRRFGEAAAEKLAAVRPTAVYAFTHGALESLRFAHTNGIPSCLDNVNTHLADMREAVVTESQRYGCGTYRGYPTAASVARGDEEFELANCIRVPSQLSKDALIARGIAAEKIALIPLPVDVTSFRPEPKSEAGGPLRICFVGSLDLRKGFVPLLRAMRKLGPGALSLEIVGNTGDACCNRLLLREREGLDVVVHPGDPRPAYRRAELFVLPSLEDGFGLVVPEALASGLPVIATDRCGAAEWVSPGETGWIIPAGDIEALAAVLQQAIASRENLPNMGIAARRSVEIRMAERSPVELAHRLSERLTPCRSTINH